MVNLRYVGEWEDLCEVLLEHAVYGVWSEQPNGVVMFHSNCGAKMHWSSTRGTIWVDGPRDACGPLLRRLRTIFSQLPG